MKKLQKRKRAKITFSFCLLFLVAVVSVVTLTAKADISQGESGENSAISSQILSEEESSEESSSVDSSSTDSSTEESLQPFAFSGRAATTTYNVASGPKTIPVGSGDWILEGTYKGLGAEGVPSDATSRAVIFVEYGYIGTITLNGATIETTDDSAGILLYSGIAGDNSDPTTKVKLLLSGTNSVQAYPEEYDGFHAAVETMLGTQVTIDGTGSLYTKSGISTPNPTEIDDYQMTCAAGIGSGGSDSGYPLGGGNVIIQGGTIESHGGDHGAGIGGGMQAGTTNVVIIGGNITSFGGVHSNAIGKGCDVGGGATNDGILVALPPATISASTPGTKFPGSGFSSVGGMGGGTAYVGDPTSPLAKVYTENNIIGADIFIDFGNVPLIVEGLKLAGIDATSTASTLPSANTGDKYYIGTTIPDPSDPTKGVFNLHADIVENLTFFTDALDGGVYPHFPVVTNVTANKDIELPKANVELKTTLISGVPIDMNKNTAPTALQNQEFEFEVSGNVDVENIEIVLEGEHADKFKVVDRTELPPSILTTDTSRKGKFTIGPIGPLPAGIYKTSVKVTGTLVTGSGSGALSFPTAAPPVDSHPQMVGKKDGSVGGYGSVTATPDPSNIWSNSKTINLEAKADEVAHPGDAVDFWSYAVTKNSTPPVDGSLDWQSITVSDEEDLSVAHEFGAGTDDTYYVHWNMETLFAENMHGTITAPDNTTQTYNIDLVRPEVASMSNPFVLDDVLAGTMKKVKITFTEPVDTLTAAMIDVQGGSIGTITTLDTAVNGQYKEFEVEITPNATLVGGDVFSVEIPENVTEDRATNKNTYSNDAGKAIKFTIVKNITVTAALTTGTPPDLLIGETPGTAHEQKVLITNSGTTSLKDLAITLTGADAGSFTITSSPGATLGKLGSGSNTMEVIIKPNTGLGVATYNGTIHIEGKAVSSGGVEDPIPAIDVALKPQIVKKKVGVVGTDGIVTAVPAPSNNWTNITKLDITAAADASNTDDAVEEWSYAVSTNLVPPVLPSDWTTISGGVTTSEYTFPATANTTYYVHWKLETKYATGMQGKVTAADNSVTYNVDLIRPKVDKMTAPTTTNDASIMAGTAMDITVKFTEPVDTLTAAMIDVAGGTVGTITTVGTPVNGQYSEFTVRVTPNSGLAGGDVFSVKIPENKTRDRAGNLNLPNTDSDANIEFTLGVTTKMEVNRITTTNPPDLLFGATPDGTHEQKFEITNKSTVPLKDLAITLDGANASSFTVASTSPTGTTLGKDGSGSEKMTVIVKPIAGLALGSYNGKIVVSAKGVLTDGTEVAIGSESADLLEQKVKKKDASAETDGSSGKVTANFDPSATWKNETKIDLQAHADGTKTDDAVEYWSYAVTESPTAPTAVGDWTTISGGVTTAEYTFPATANTTYYVHWKVETHYATGMHGTITAPDNTTQTYNIDLIRPKVDKMTASAGTNDASIMAGTPMDVTIKFTEPVDTVDASMLAVVGGTVGTIATVGTPVNGQYSEFTVRVTPNSGLVGGDVFSVEFPENKTKDRAGNLNLPNTDADANLKFTLGVTTKMEVKRITTATPPDLLFGTTPDATHEQKFEITNKSTVPLKDITVTLGGANASSFAVQTLSGTTLGKDGSGSEKMTVIITPKAGLALGSYNGNIVVSAKGVLTDGTEVAIGSESANLLEQKVKKKDASAETDGSSGKVKANFDPSAAWKNETKIDLQAHADGTKTDDAVEYWSYAVTTSATAPTVPGDWTTISGGITTAQYTFPAGSNTTYYVHWKVETHYATGMHGTITAADNTTKTYNIDLIRPKVDTMTTTSTITTIMAGQNVDVAIKFSEPVTTLTDAMISVVGGTITGTVTPVGTPVNGQYSQFKVTITPTPGFMGGDTFSVTIPENQTDDRAGNKNTFVDDGVGSIRFGAAASFAVAATRTAPVAAPPVLLRGVDPSGSSTYDQTIQVTNMGNTNLKNIQVSLTGANASSFEIVNPSALPLTLGKNGSANYQFNVVIRPKNGLSVGHYNGSVAVSAVGVGGGGTEQNVAATPVALWQQEVKKKDGSAETDGSSGIVKADIDPSINWINASGLNLTASASTGDSVESWSYAISTGAAPTNPAEWATISDATTAAGIFPPNAENTYYIYWKLETANVTGLHGTITHNSIQTYNVDLIPPEVKSITTTAVYVGTSPFSVTVTFTEPVDMIAANKIAVTNGSIPGTITAVDTPVGGQNKVFTFAVNPAANLQEGDKITISVPGNITKDKAGNLNKSSKDSSNILTGGNNTDLEVTVNSSKPTVNYSFADQHVFVTKPSDTEITVTLISNGKTNQKLVDSITNLEITESDATSFLSVNGILVGSGGYSATMAKSGNDYVYTIKSSSGFTDGPFTISIDGNKMENSEGHKLQATQQTFYVYSMEITGISVSTPTMDYTAGGLVVTVTGRYLQHGVVEVHSGVDGQKHVATASPDGTTAQFAVNIPQNDDYENSKEHQFSPLLNGNAATFTDKVSVYRKPSMLDFDLNGGDASTKPDQIEQDKGTPVDISNVQPGEPGEPSRKGHIFMGWAYADGSSVSNQVTMQSGSNKVIAQWLDLSKLGEVDTNDVVGKKDSITKGEVEKKINGKLEYTDGKGVVHYPEVEYDWDDRVISEGGVAIIHPYIRDPKTGEPIYFEKDVYLYILNDPYISGADYLVVFEGDSVLGGEFGVSAIGEEVDFATHSIYRVSIPVEFHNQVDTSTAGLYPSYFTATFTNHLGEVFNLRHDVQVKVMKRAELTKEEKLQSESSDYWVKVASIYHKIKPGEIWEVNPDNYLDGGRMVSEGSIPKDAGYNYLLNVTVGKYVYMNPIALDQVREATDSGQMVMSMEGRELSINHTDFATNPNRSFAPRGYFDLRMSVEKNEKVTALVGNQTQMQLHFDMDRAWMAEPYFTLQVTEDLNKAAEEGSTLYLFNYNAKTNSLDLVGPMIPAGNGKQRIQMKGVYKDYVILAGLPTTANYKITEKTNNLGSGILKEIGQNYVDNGKAKTVEEGINIASVTIQTINGDEMFDSLKEYEAFSGNKISKVKNGKIVPIAIGSGGAIGLGAAFYLWKRKRHSEES